MTNDRKPYRVPNSRPWITDDDVVATQQVLFGIQRGEFDTGSEVAAFERELAEFFGRKYVVCVSSGTAALELAQKAAPRSENGEIETPAFGFIATPNAIAASGHDVGFNDNPMWAHILGEVVPCTKTDVVDAAQAFGAKLPPSLADCYSFNVNKPVTTLGGGCVATDDTILSIQLKLLRNQGRNADGLCRDAPGTNARMSDMAAALGRSQLRRVDEILERRRQVARWYSQHLAKWGGDAYRKTHPSRFLYPIELSNRDEVHAKMLERGIQTRSCADWLLPAHPYYAEKYGYKRGDFPEAERRADRTLLLPLCPEMTLEQVQEVCTALEECNARS